MLLLVALHIVFAVVSSTQSGTRRSRTVMQGYFDWEACSSNVDKLEAASSFFDENGYVVFTSFCSASETTSMRLQAGKIIFDFHNPGSTTSSPASIFTTEDQTRKMDDDYFLRSSSNISCFLEDHQEGDSAAPAINKIGHALHDLDPVFSSFSRSPKVRAVASALSVNEPLLVQSMYILKGARVGGQVRPHRDATFVRARSGTCLGYWWALQDADEDNACLWAVPRSHRDGREMRRFVLDGKGEKTVFEGREDVDVYEDEKYVPLPVKEGDLVMLHGGVVHKSEENRSGRSRHAYSLHVVAQGLEKRCWLRRPESFPFRPL